MRYADDNGSALHADVTVGDDYILIFTDDILGRSACIDIQVPDIVGRQSGQFDLSGLPVRIDAEIDDLIHTSGIADAPAYITPT